LTITAPGYFNIINKTINYEPALQALSAITCYDNISFHWVGSCFCRRVAWALPAAGLSTYITLALGSACTVAPEVAGIRFNPSYVCKVINIVLIK
jgi:hypothetical protein